jgi:CBS domain-containing protein
VLDWGRITGILTKTDLLTALEDHGEDYPIRSAMRRSFPTAEPGEMLARTLERIQKSGIGTMAVILEGRVVGLVTLEHLSEYLTIE